MDNTTSMLAQRKLGFLHHIRLVPLFSSILGGIILLFALSSGLAGYFLLQADNDQQDVTSEIQVRMGLSNKLKPFANRAYQSDPRRCGKPYRRDGCDEAEHQRGGNAH